MNNPALIILLVLIVVVLFSVIGIHNTLVKLRARYRNGFSQIDVQLKRRYDLIPNLVETAKGYLKHERETLEAVVKARNQAMSAAQAAGAAHGESGTLQSLGNAEGALQGALGRLMVVVERYPDLKADKNMMMLQEEITATENKVAFARQAYNDAVMVYNTKREVFPSNLLAGAFGFTAAQLFEITESAEREAPRVQF